MKKKHTFPLERWHIAWNLHPGKEDWKQSSACVCLCVWVCVCVMTNPLNIHALSRFEIGSLRKKVPITQVTFNPSKSCQHQDIHQSPGCSYFPPKLLASLVHGWGCLSVINDMLLLLGKSKENLHDFIWTLFPFEGRAGDFMIHFL